MSNKSYKAVFFDAGHTLLYPHPGVGEVYREIAQKHGVFLEATSMNRRFSQVWHDKNKFKADPAKEEKNWWKEIVSEVVPHSAFRHFDAFFEELYIDFGSPHRWKLYDDVIPVLSYLYEKNIPILVVSNWDSRLRKVCAFYNLTQYFKEIIISAEVGLSKPSEKIFSLALEKVGLIAKDVIHIGDSPVDDVQGAKGVGIIPVYLNRRGKKLANVWSITTLIDII